MRRVQAPIRGGVEFPINHLGVHEEAEALQACAHLPDLVLGRRDEGQPMASHAVPEQVQSRFDRDRVRSEP